MTLLTIGFLVYGIYILGELGAIQRVDDSLVAVLRRRLRFYRTKYEVWLWMLAVMIPFLSFSVSTLADVQDGQYRINRPEIFAGVTVAQLIFMYVILKIAHYPFIRQQQAVLSDLENQVTTATDRVQASRKTWRWWGVALVAIGTALLILGILRAVA
jgi:cytochrome bd-type quinol oxidase subunit 2